MPKWIKRGTVIRAAADLLEESMPYFDDSLVAMSINPDITGCSKTITIDGVVVTISFEREEDEL